MPDTGEVEWRKLRADQLRDHARQDAIVILPVASLEQHGPHLPVEVDSMLGEAVALRTAREATARGQTTLVLPVLWTGLSEHHMSFGGTITLAAYGYWVNAKGWVMVIGTITAYAAIAAYPRNIAIQVALSLLLGILSCTAWALFGTALRPILTSRRAVRAFNIVMAVLLLASLYPVFMDV